MNDAKAPERLLGKSDEASSASFVDSTIYGLRILNRMVRYGSHRMGIRRRAEFEKYEARYTRVA